MVLSLDSWKNSIFEEMLHSKKTFILAKPLVVHLYIKYESSAIKNKFDTCHISAILYKNRKKTHGF